jgi:hypothetical protein
MNLLGYLWLGGRHYWGILSQIGGRGTDWHTHGPENRLERPAEGAHSHVTQNYNIITSLSMPLYQKNVNIRYNNAYGS